MKAKKLTLKNILLAMLYGLWFSILAIAIFLISNFLMNGRCWAGIPINSTYTIKAIITNGGVYQTGQTVSVGVMRNSDLYWYNFTSNEFISDPATECYDTMLEYEEHPIFGFYYYTWEAPIKKKFTISNRTGTMTAGDEIKGCTSFATGIILSISNTLITIDSISGTFSKSEKVCPTTDSCPSPTNYVKLTNTGSDIPEIYTFFAISSGDVKMYDCQDISEEMINFYFGQ